MRAYICDKCGGRIQGLYILLTRYVYNANENSHGHNVGNNINIPDEHVHYPSCEEPKDAREERQTLAPPRRQARRPGRRVVVRD